MYLRRLTMKGFKSFADATTLEFEPGVTVVVGPNGSGKSNVVDAVTWVLGAQGPRALRSAKMEDVIFMGTANRPALGRAEVSLTIDNADGALKVSMAEVTITRTLFRSGDSEYAINGTPCRLLDVQELLSDSGVGRQQHMIIGQGQLSAVLNARPDERRSIIEEAAGVLKHRRRKERAERRLASTQENLERLGDLVREVRRQMRPLERQAAAARSYETLHHERIMLRRHLAGEEFATLSSRREEIASTLRHGQTTEHEMRAELARLDAQASATAAGLSGGPAEDLAQSVADVHGLVERAKGLGAVLAQRSRGVAQALDASADADVVASLEADSAKVRVDIDRVDQEANELGAERRQLAEAEGSLARAEEEYDATWGGGQIDDALEELARARERAELLGRATRVRHEAVLDLERRRQQLDERRLELEVTRDTASTTRDASRAEVVRLTAELERSDEMLAQARSALFDAEKVLQDAEGDAARATARADALARALDQVTGGSGRHAIGEVDGVVGSLVDLLVVDPGWEAAVEAAAGAAVAAVVVDDSRAARAALERLRTAGATGLILAATSALAGSRDRLPDGVDVLRDHVRARAGSPASVDVVLDRLFGATVRAATLSAAVDLAIDHPDLVVVTQAGDRLSSAGWRVSGGGEVVTAAGVEEAERAAEKARHDAAQASETRHNASAALEAASELHAATRRALDLAASSVDAEQRVLDTTSASIGRIEEEAIELGSAAEVARASLDEEQRALAALTEQLPDLEDAAARAAERASWAREAAATLDAHRAQVLSLRQGLEVRAAALSERRRTLEARLDQIEARLAGHVDERAHAAARRQRLEADAVAIERLARLVHASHDRLVVVLDARRAAYASELRSVRASNERLEQLRRDRNAAEAALSNHLSTTRSLDIEAAEVAVKLEALTEMIRTELDTEPAATIGAPAPALPEGVTPHERAAALDRELEALGPINPLALEELSALEERHEEIDRQVTDVRSAKRELHEVVRALDEEIMSTFAAAAADVNEHFSALVATLFPGGQGRLILTEPDDLLSTGVEVEVRPGGRNVRRVSLLSGGEQSMAALAFLFAVFRSRPSPFYLMDEVEAALDDVNLHRFLGLIREFRDEAQLLIVSHQKRTMETGDALYGVTMKPGGSSQVVSQRVVAGAEPSGTSS